jgi:hypothetical protein
LDEIKATSMLNDLMGNEETKVNVEQKNSNVTETKDVKLKDTSKAIEEQIEKNEIAIKVDIPEGTEKDIEEQNSSNEIAVKDDILECTDNNFEDKRIKFNIRKVPTAVIIVDLFQILMKYSDKSLNIAIVISAWDKILNLRNGITPSRWLKQTLPLLHQFLKSNRNQINFKLFGISAQGGDYETDSDTLQQFSNPSDRIKVQDEDIVDNDITVPIKWLLTQIS